ncbi:hypothetical protein [Ensifer adhaerens]
MARNAPAGAFWISPRYHNQDWLSLTLDPNNPDEIQWAQAADILEDRITARFLKPAQELINLEAGKSSGTYGFAVLALDFLVAETIQGFREGRIDHTGKSSKLFKRFMVNWSEFQASVPIANERSRKALLLYENGRCALHHSGTTDKIKVNRSGNLLVFHADGRIEINRTDFHAGLTNEFARHIAALKHPASVVLRTNLKTKMDAICHN